MTYEEGKVIAQVNVEEAAQGVEQPKTKLASLYVEEWVYFLRGSSHAQTIISIFSRIHTVSVEMQ